MTTQDKKKVLRLLQQAGFNASTAKQFASSRLDVETGDTINCFYHQPATLNPDTVTATSSRLNSFVAELVDCPSQEETVIFSNDKGETKTVWTNRILLLTSVGGGGPRKGTLLTVAFVGWNRMFVVGMNELLYFQACDQEGKVLDNKKYIPHMLDRVFSLSEFQTTDRAPIVVGADQMLSLVEKMIVELSRNGVIKRGQPADPGEFLTKHLGLKENQLIGVFRFLGGRNRRVARCQARLTFLSYHSQPLVLTIDSPGVKPYWVCFSFIHFRDVATGRFGDTEGEVVLMMSNDRMLDVETKTAFYYEPLTCAGLSIVRTRPTIPVQWGDRLKEFSTPLNQPTKNEDRMSKDKPPFRQLEEACDPLLKALGIDCPGDPDSYNVPPDRPPMIISKLGFQMLLEEEEEEEHYEREGPRMSGKKRIRASFT